MEKKKDPNLPDFENFSLFSNRQIFMVTSSR
jgi:hypothetical protein